MLKPPAKLNLQSESVASMKQDERVASMAKAVKKKAPSKEVSSPQMVDPFAGFRSEMDRLFETYFGRAPFASFPRFELGWGKENGPVMPDVDMKEDDKAISVSAELPGMEEKDIELTLKDGLLTLKGEKKSEKTSGKENAHVTERRYGSFQRSFRLPENIDQDKISASFDKGVLKVDIPKRPEAVQKAKRIAIGR